MNFSSLSFKKKLGLVSLVVLASQLVCLKAKAMEDLNEIPPQNNSLKRKAEEKDEISKKQKRIEETTVIFNGSQIQEDNNVLNIEGTNNTNFMEVAPSILQFQPTIMPNHHYADSTNYTKSNYYSYNYAYNYNYMPVQNYNPIMIGSPLIQPYLPIMPNAFNYNPHAPVQNFYNPVMTGNPSIQSQPPIIQNTSNNNPRHIPLQNPHQNEDRKKHIQDTSPMKRVTTFLMHCRSLEDFFSASLPLDVRNYILQYYISLSPRITISRFIADSSMSEQELLNMLEASPFIKKLDFGNVVSARSLYPGRLKLPATGLLTMVRKCFQLNSLKLPLEFNIVGTQLQELFQECPHLTSLTLPSCYPKQIKGKKIPGEELLTAMEKCSNLTVLNLSDWKHITGEQVQRLVGMLSNLTSLGLESCTKIKGPEVLSIIKRCPKLISLTLEEMSISAKQLRTVVEERPNLTFLNLYLIKQLNVANLLAIYEKCTQLTSLNLSLWGSMNEQAGTAEKFLILIQKYPNLTSLKLDGAIHFTIDQFLPVLKACPKLTNLDLNWLSDFTTVEQGLIITTAYSKLFKLKTSFDNRIESFLAVMQAHPELTSLDLGLLSNDLLFLYIAKMCSNLTSLKVREATKETIAELKKNYPHLLIKK